jgi:FkbM family methyltransferase
MKIQHRNTTFNINPGINKDAWDYINKGHWEPLTFDILDFFSNKNSVAIDLGSWSGVISLYLANTIEKVHAIDPDPVCFKELQENILLNPDLKNKIAAYQIAISDKKETIKLSARKEYGKSSTSILRRKRDNETSFEISTISLLDFIEQNKIEKVDFIKMDIEGAEFKVLPSIGKALEKMQYPTLYISFHYAFLNETIYTKKIPFVFMNKLFLKVEKIIGINIFKDTIGKIIYNSWNQLDKYNYIYTDNGKPVNILFLKKNPEFLKKNNLVFTNIKWK